MSDKSSIDSWLAAAIRLLLEAEIPSARLDAELILAHTLRKGRTWLHAHGEEALDARHREIANARLDLRLDRVPIAYIIGHKEFYGRMFAVTTAVLIPRPESEALVELIGELPLAPGMTLVDVGTGSGCLGITAKCEHPELDVTLLDISTHALTVAEKNAQALGADVTCLRSDLLAGYPAKADIIVANLPYVDPDWSELSPELRHEPSIALFAEDDGLALIKRLINQSKHSLTPHGWLLLEADARQHHAIRHYAESRGLRFVDERGLIALYQAASR